MATSSDLPPGLVLSLRDRIDSRLAWIVGGSIVLHGAIAIAAWLGDVPEDSLGTTSPTVAITYQQEVIDILVPDLTLPSVPAAATPVAAATQTARPIVQPTRITTSRPETPIDSQGLAAILTGAGNHDETRPTFHLDPGTAETHGPRIGEGTHTSRPVDDPRVTTQPGDPTIVDDPTLTHAPSPSHDEPHGRIVPGQVKPTGETTTLTAASVLDRINTVYMAGLQRCYRLGLANDATLSGRVSITLTVDERGQVIDPDASGVSSGVDACISKQMNGWRFAVPKDTAGKPTEATFSVSLALQPS